MGDYTHWHVGMKVVCLEEGHVGDIPNAPPHAGEVCTVAWLGTDGDDVLIDLQEYPKPECDVWFRGYFARYFRPVQTRPTDITIFTSMLVNPPKELAYEMPGRPFE